MTWVMRVTQAMAQIGEFGGQGWGVGIVFVSSPNGPGEETVSLDEPDWSEAPTRGQPVKWVTSSSSSPWNKQ